MFKISITKRKLLTLEQVKDLPAGTLLRVIDKRPEEESDCTGEIVIKTGNEDYPFATVIGVPPYTNVKGNGEDCYVLWEVYGEGGFDFELIGLGHEVIKLENDVQDKNIK